MPSGQPVPRCVIRAVEFAEQGSAGLAARYNQRVRFAFMMRFAVVIVAVAVAVAACGSAGPSARAPAGHRVAAGTSVATSGTPQPGPTGPLRDIGCLTPTCAFHPGTGTYFTCTSSGAGTCFHFGPACNPSDGCMYDPAARTYKLCTANSEGKCQAWGAACAPASKCMFDARDGLHRQCEAIAGGGCSRYGALCAP